MEPQEYDSIIRHLAAAIAKQDTINDDLRACIREQRAMNERVEGFIQQQVFGVIQRLLRVRRAEG